MSFHRRWLRLPGVALLILLLAACGGAPRGAGGAAPADGDEAAGAPSQVVTWYYYDQNNTDPQANERVGNFYLARAIPKFNEEFAGRYEWVNVPRDYNLVLDLVAAVRGNGDIPDVMRTGVSDLPTFIVNNTVQDLTEFVTTAPWYDDLDPKAVEACTGPDGNIYCVPVSESPYVVFYWTDLYPNGFPKTPDALLAEAERIQAAGRYALTYFGSTGFDGEAAGRYFFQVLSSFGGGYDDGAGNLRLNTPENIAAIEFMREIVRYGYSPEAVFVGNFEEEAAFKDAEAAAFPTGHYIAYLYLNPLIAPDGTEYNTATQQDIEDAVAAGDIAIAPFVAPAGQVPGCNNDIFGFVIPNGAKNVEGAKAYINWIMEPDNAVEWVLNAGGGLPTSVPLRAHEAFQTPIFRQGVAAAEASACRPWFGSLLNIPEAKKIISTTLFDLIKGNPEADIVATLTAAEEAYNRNN
jgi:ABC-type glycerol-3-phosphate transport system substrate-binding protein